MTLIYTQGHHSGCYLMAIWHITACLWTVVSTSLSMTVFKTLTTTFGVNVTACDLENSFVFDNET